MNNTSCLHHQWCVTKFIERKFKNRITHSLAITFAQQCIALVLAHIVCCQIQLHTFKRKYIEKKKQQKIKERERERLLVCLNIEYKHVHCVKHIFLVIQNLLCVFAKMSPDILYCGWCFGIQLAIGRCPKLQWNFRKCLCMSVCVSVLVLVVFLAVNEMEHIRFN